MPPPPYTGQGPLHRSAEGPVSLANATAHRIASHRNDGKTSNATHGLLLETNILLTDSWVEVASQPSSSSVSSIADEIVITGLRVGSNANGANANNGFPSPQRRRRLLQQVEAATANPSVTVPPAPSSLADSSQEEYDETESEEEHVVVESGPRLASATAANRAARLASDVDDEDEDEDDNGTALGVPSVPTFRPQPNAFSHPPTHSHQQAFLGQHQQHHSVPAPPHQHIAPPYARSMSSRSALHRQGRNSAPSFMVPTYREDNEAALRASLSTLLSCAAAARGLPKKDVTDTSTFAGPASGSEQSPATAAGLIRPSDQPMGLRLVPESELMGDGGNMHTVSRANDTSGGISPRTRAAPFQRTSPGTSRPKPAETGHHRHSSRNSAASTVSTSSKTKRSGGASKPSSSPRVTKKKRTLSSTDESGGIAFMSLSPTLLTWVVSAGVVVLVSVVGFGAGFVIGREVGRQEAGSTILDAASVSNAASLAASTNATSCGREIMRSSTGSTLRRFRWGAMTTSVSA